MDEYDEEKPVRIQDPTKMSVNERWACLEHWYSIGHLEMLAWKPRTMRNSLTPLPLEDCWWHSAFPGKQSQIRRGKQNRRTKPGSLAPPFHECEEQLPDISISNFQNSQELVPEISAFQSSGESITGAQASEPQRSGEFVLGTLGSPAPESQEQISGLFAIQSSDQSPDSLQVLPKQPYSASSALAGVNHTHTAADIRRREGHSEYQLGLDQRKINREVRRAANQDTLGGGLVQILQKASDPDASLTDTPTGYIDATAVDISVSDIPSYSQRQLRKRKRNVTTSDSESEGALDDAPGPSNHSEQPYRNTTPVPDSRRGKDSFFILLSPFRQPSKSKKHRSGT